MARLQATSDRGVLLAVSWGSFEVTDGSWGATMGAAKQSDQQQGRHSRSDSSACAQKSYKERQAASLVDRNKLARVRVSASPQGCDPECPSSPP